MTTTADPPPAGAEGTIDADIVAQLVARLRGICGDEHVLSHAHDLRTYQSDGLLHYHVVPRWRCCPPPPAKSPGRSRCWSLLEANAPAGGCDPGVTERAGAFSPGHGPATREGWPSPGHGASTSTSRRAVRRSLGSNDEGKPLSPVTLLPSWEISDLAVGDEQVRALVDPMLL